MPARVSPTPLMLTSRSRLAHSSGSSSIVSAMARSTASSWEVKCWIVASASDSAMSSSMPLVLRFVHCVKPATVPARIVWSSHNRRRAGDGGVQGVRFEQLSVFADVRGIDLIGLVAPQLGAREVANLGGIDEAHDVPGLMERQRDAQAVMSGRLQASMDLSNLVLG